MCLLGSYLALPVTSAAPVLRKQELELARNDGLAACIITRYPGTALAKNAPKPARTKNGAILHLQSCLDFANSAAYAKEVRKWLRH